MIAYRKFHGLSGSAFGKSVPAKSLLVYPQLQELSEELDTLVEDGGIGVITGEMGMGKTTALRHYFESLGERSCQLCYQGASRHPTALLESVVEGLGVAPTRIRASLLRQINQRVDRMYQEQRKKTMLILDEAHLLEDGLLEDLRLLTNYEMDTRDPLILVLVGHPGLRLRLQRPVHQALWDRVRTSYRLEGLSAKETSDYIDCHLKYAGGKPGIFSPDAREVIFELAQGIPRRINALALACLKKSTQRKTNPIDGAFVRATNKLREE
ncbi:MAG: AAA family ATPase [Nitrospira sp.]|nr:AAA family ATPase [Nitrospira sp.]MCW5869063.1 AAA family ATPase [Candidatus Eremiobacteraeota bacterium]